MSEDPQSHSAVAAVPAESVPESGRAGYVGPGIASVRGDIRGVRYLLYACIALLIVLMVGVSLGVASLRSQVDDLQAQLAARTAESPATVTADQPPAGTPATVIGPAVALDGVDRPNGTDEAGAILVGDPNARTVIETFIDYQCPFCQRWEATFGAALMDRALEPGSGLLVKQNNLAFLKETSPSLVPAGASARAANAAACVVDADGQAVFAAFSRSVFEEADPSEPPGQFSTPFLVELAAKAGASQSALACIDDERFVPFVAASTQAGFSRGVTGTPTVVVDGVAVENAFSDPTVSGLVSAGS